MHAVSDDVGATANAEFTGIEHKIIVVGVGPPPSRILEVVVAASLVHLFNIDSEVPKAITNRIKTKLT